MLDQPIHQVSFTAIDFESAGTASGKTDAPIQIGTTSWNLKEGITDSWTSYIHTDQSITWAAQKVHGITPKDLLGAPKLPQLWPDVKSRLLQHAVVAHGHGTEKRFLRAYPGHGFGPWVDTLTLGRKLWPSLESHSLGSLCTFCELEPRINAIVPEKSWHDALYDAAASMVLLSFMIETYELSEKPLATLLPH